MINDDDDADHWWRRWRSTMTMITINDDDNDNQCIAMITMMTINLSKSGEHDPCVSQVHPSLHELNSKSFFRVGLSTVFTSKKVLFGALQALVFVTSSVTRRRHLPPSVAWFRFKLCTTHFLREFYLFLKKDRFREVHQISEDSTSFCTSYWLSPSVSHFFLCEISKLEEVPCPFVGMGILEPDDKVE